MKTKCCAHTLTSTEAQNLLVEYGLNRTKAKVGIVVALAKAKKPLSAIELHGQLGAHSCDISTIFRTLTQLKEKGLVRELNLGEDFSRFEFSPPSKDKHGHHHHYVRCRDCGDIKAIEKCDLSAFEKMIARLGFHNMEHSLEFTGTCSRCS
jgi:Fe2+ or Zn2+ uptake regulation protein